MTAPRLALRAATLAWLVTTAGCFIYKGVPSTGDTGACITPACSCAAEDALTLYADNDGDGAGNPSDILESCEPIDGYTEDATDCDDGDRLVHPGAAEICDGKDNDCDPSTVESGATFVGAEGGIDQLTDDLAVGAPGAPVALVLPIPGTLNLCAGDWYTSLQVDADVDIVGVGGSQAVTVRGGDLVPGVVVDGPRTATVRGLTLEGSAPIVVDKARVGGALACSGNAVVSASDLVFLGSDAAPGVVLGGLVSVRDRCTIDVSDSTLFGGSGWYGGQVYVEGASATFANTDFTGGSAFGGGSVFVGNFLDYYGYTASPQTATFTCAECTFSDNAADQVDEDGVHYGAGGAILSFGALVNIDGGSLGDNVAGESGGAVAMFPSSSVPDPDLPQTTFTETTFSGNVSASSPNDVYIDGKPPGLFTFGPEPQSVLCGPTTCK